MDYKDYCMNCGHLIHILDNEMTVGSFLRAMQSIPKNILQIKGSLMEGYGVYARRNIPKGVKFGPYEGLETVKRRNKYLWKIKYAKLIEANGEDYCNWMRFINCATTQPEQNLIALQFMGKLYYRTLRELTIGEELLIYYGSSGYDHSKLYSVQYLQPDIEEVNENIFKCPPCCFGFSEEKYLVNHNRVCPYKKKEAIEENSSTGIKDFEDYPKVCPEINNLSSNHQKDNENGKVYKNADLDDEAVMLEQDLIKHVKVNNKEEKVKLICTGTLKEQIVKHQIKNCEESMILNDTNGKNWSEPSVRLCKAKKPSLKINKCNECSYATVRKSNLLSHVKSRHTKEKPYKCNECSYVSARKSQLVSHVKSRHTMEKSYKCNDCSFATVLKGNLTSHIKSRHTMVKPYNCKECSYAAARKNNLLTHIKSHHNIEKPYKEKLKCNECFYASARKDVLIKHINSCHTKEKPYKCNKCSYVSAVKWGLVTHIKHCHAKEKPDKCNEFSYASV